MLYRISRLVVRLVLRLYFRDLEISRESGLPGRGPVVFAANHPQSITDTLVLGLGVGRKLHYVAHAGLFRNPLKAWFLRRSGVIPVYRPEETADAAMRNEGMFRECARALERGDAIGIFPEGTSREAVRVQPFKTGTARIALETESARGFGLGVAIVPVGISFESRRRFRSRVLVNFGTPIAAADYREAYRDDPRGTVQALTVLLERRTRALVLNLEHEEFAGFLRELERIYRDELLEDPGAASGGATPFARRQALSRELARAVDYYNRTDPGLVALLMARLGDYRKRLDRVRLSDRQIREERTRGVKGEASRLLAAAAAGLPFALYGAFWNILPYKLTGWIAARMAPDGTKYHFYQITVGAVLYGLYYPPIIYLAYILRRPLEATGFLVSLVPTGFFARWYGREMTLQRGRLRLAYLTAAHGYVIGRLRYERRTLIEELNRVRADYTARFDPDRDGAS